MEQTSRRSKILQIIALGVAGGSIYLIPYIRYVFYDWQMSAMGISNTQLGLLTTAYTIGNIILYIPGGVIADKFSTKKSIIIALGATTLLTFIFAFRMGSFAFALIVWGLFAVTTTFLFWDSLFKTLRLVADEDEQGFMFGLYYMCNGLTGAIVNAVGLKVAGAFGTTDQSKFFWAVVVYAIATGVAALLVAIFLKDNKSAEALSVKNEEDEFHFSMVGQLLKNPTVWAFALIVFCGYAIYSSTSYFTPYLTDVKGVSPEDSGYLSIIRTYIFYIVSPLSGLLADKVIKSTSKWFIFLFVILGLLYAGVFIIPAGASVGAVSFYTLLPGLFGLALYGIIFSIASEIKIPAAVMGTAVGLASIIGYLPDLFMATMFGSWLDKLGNAGYNYIFIFLTAVSAVGLLLTLFVRSRAKKLA
ncbi:MAG: MFS transporter [Eubacteriaceae bacterium]|jgi:sugar phosphate permease|nr:MFS transporter [Eubacteriaceae bacterium]